MKHLTYALLCLVGLNACHSSSSHTAGADLAPAAAGTSAQELWLNDVSILFPLAKVSGMLAKMPQLVNTDPSKSFAPVGYFDTLVKAILADDTEQPGSVEVQMKGDLDHNRVVAMRLDPCANLRTSQGDGDCVPQLRLLWQNMDDDKFRAEDRNFHTAYRLERSEMLAIVKTMQELQQGGVASLGRDYQAEPLGPHPVMIKQGLDGAYFKGVLDIIARYARPDKLMAISALADTDIGGHWPMIAFRVDQGKLIDTPVIAANLLNGKASRVQFAGGAEAGLELPQPLGTHPDSMFKANDSAPERDAADIYKRSFLVVDPRRSDVFNMDCANCHRVREQRSNAMAELGSSLPAVTAFASTKKAWNMTNITGRVEDTHLQMFSYDTFGDPIIAERVITESVAVADYLNDHYLSTDR